MTGLAGMLACDCDWASLVERLRDWRPISEWNGGSEAVVNAGEPRIIDSSSSSSSGSDSPLPVGESATGGNSGS